MSISKPFITKFEYTKVIGLRAEQLEKGITPRVEFSGKFDALKIAEKEFKENKLDYIIERKLPDGKIEAFHVRDLKKYYN